MKTKLILPILTLLVALNVPGSAFAAIGTPTSIGQATSTSSTTNLSVTLSSGVAAGNTIIVSLALHTTNSAAASAADTKSNTYTQNANALNSSGSIRTLVFSAPVTTALISGNTISVTYPSSSVAALDIYYVSGLVSASPADQTATATNDSTSHNTVPTS